MSDGLMLSLNMSFSYIIFIQEQKKVQKVNGLIVQHYIDKKLRKNMFITKHFGTHVCLCKSFAAKSTQPRHFREILSNFCNELSRRDGRGLVLTNPQLI